MKVYYVCIDCSPTGENPKGLIIGSGEGSKVNISCPALAMEPTRRQETRCPMASINLLSTMSR